MGKIFTNLGYHCFFLHNKKKKQIVARKHNRTRKISIKISIRDKSNLDKDRSIRRRRSRNNFETIIILVEKRETRRFREKSWNISQSTANTEAYVARFIREAFVEHGRAYYPSVTDDTGNTRKDVFGVCTSDGIFRPQR